ncbi:ATPase [Arthrobacter sp. YC-RL1]|uniref:SRPBCC family protein n=1 Tax=Arthrobacter sp. YC-RL1 TaxID=1652545 RepID=UPI00063DB2C6|nr:SRPBCC family protein [Arthrobacter sp. YC-RL1]ALQ32125.1 ATPase [Arthrobacter sp. YC-RL1]KLI90612.1 ATPase [Arthrobacter sp. YC-RL1]
MPVTSVLKDPETLTLTVHANFPVPVSRLWDAYLDPRQIEKFWGPVEYPATFTRHDGAVGGRSNYYMTSPEGEQFHGYWIWNEVVEHKFFEVTDGFAHSDGSVNEDLPATRTVFSFDSHEEGSKLTITANFDSAEELEQVVVMGMIDGTRSAMSQIEQVLIDLRNYAQTFATEAQLLSDTQVRVSRLIRGTQEQVWRAHHDPELMKRWLLGPDGWQMTECILPKEVGDSYRYWWEPNSGVEGQGFGFAGVCLSSTPRSFESFTEQMIDTDYPATVNETTFTPVQSGTLLSLVITYPDPQTRDMVLATGMTEGMEASYARLESLL